MSEPVVRVERLSKRYRLGGGEPYGSLRDQLARLFRRQARPSPTEFWALRDVTLDVQGGEVLGLIGRNGAGKSTLLKVLARITWPTSGRAEVLGRVSSLLEVGAGFHPELTGRENVHLNGAIMGMSRREVRQRFEQIVEFSEVGEFLDVPLKRYSSGMRVRLAFAVAAHLDPEVLFVDEVLAVGDLSFQRKCLGHMSDVARSGRTVLFVSHHMNQVRRLCTRAVWLEGGGVRLAGPTAEVVSAYETAMTAALRDGDVPRALGDQVKAAVVGWELAGQPADQPYTLSHTGPLTVKFVLQVARPLQVRRQGLALCDNEGRVLWGTVLPPFSAPVGRRELMYGLPGLPLRPGNYFWKISLFDDDGLVDLYDATPPMLIATEPVCHPSTEWAGILNVPCQFEHRAP